MVVLEDHGSSLVLPTYDSAWPLRSFGEGLPQVPSLAEARLGVTRQHIHHGGTLILKFALRPHNYALLAGV